MNDTRFYCSDALRLRLRMDNFKFTVVSLVCMAPFTVFAGYAQVAPPPNWSEVAGKHFYKAAANESWVAAQTVHTNAALNVGGRAVVMPASMRLAANAGQFMARGLSLHPAWLVAGLAAPYLVEWLAKSKFKWTGTEWVEVEEGISCASDCYEFLDGQTWYTSNTAALAAVLPRIKAYQGYKSITPAGCPTPQSARCSYTYTLYQPWADGQTFTDSVLFQTRSVPPSKSVKFLPVTPEQVETGLPVFPFPEQLPKFYPDPLPVELPVINPQKVRDPAPNERPGQNPAPLDVPSPYRVPVGQPQPVPNTDPQKYKQPAVDIIPAPTKTDPWRVDVVPKDVTSTTTIPVPDKPLAPDTAIDPNAPPKTEAEKQQDLCEKNPEILACAKPEFDTPETPKLETKERDLTFNPQSGWGGSGGACPAPRHLPGANVDIEFTMFCNFMSGIKPVMLTFAALAAGMIIIGARGGAAE